MGFRRRYGALRYGSAALRVASFASLAYAVYLVVVKLLDALPRVDEVATLDDLVELLRFLLLEPLAFLVLSPVLARAADVMRGEAESMWREFARTLVGAVEAYRAVSVAQLAAKFGEPPEWIEQVLGRLRSEGVFRGTIGADGVVYAAGERPPPPPAQPAPQQPAAPQPAPAAGSDTMVVERVEPGAPAPEASEVEEMCRKGLLSEETCARLLGRA